MRLLNKNKPLSVLFWILTVAVMIFIFKFSSDTGEESEAISQNLLGIIIEFIGQFISHNTLRKLAHFTEFAALGFCVTGAIHFTFGKRKLIISLVPCIIYAISDEIHQYFVPERACRIFDVFVDSSGSLTGILIFFAFIFLITKITFKNKNGDLG